MNKFAYINERKKRLKAEKEVARLKALIKNYVLNHGNNKENIDDKKTNR